MYLLAFVCCFSLFISGAASATPVKRHLPEDTSTATAAKKATVDKPVSNELLANIKITTLPSEPLTEHNKVIYDSDVDYYDACTIYTIIDKDVIDVVLS